MTSSDRGARFFVPHVPEEQLGKAAHLDRLVNLPLALKHTFSMAPMTWTHEEIDSAWQTLARMANLSETISLNFLTARPEDASLEEAETSVRLLAAYAGLATPA
jgi:ATP-dependent RNA helicase SUPV3L1/SUV3